TSKFGTTYFAGYQLSDDFRHALGMSFYLKPTSDFSLSGKIQYELACKRPVLEPQFARLLLDTFHFIKESNLKSQSPELADFSLEELYALSVATPSLLTKITCEDPSLSTILSYEIADRFLAGVEEVVGPLPHAVPLHLFHPSIQRTWYAFCLTHDLQIGSELSHAIQSLTYNPVDDSFYDHQILQVGNFISRGLTSRYEQYLQQLSDGACPFETARHSSLETVWIAAPTLLPTDDFQFQTGLSAKKTSVNIRDLRITLEAALLRSIREALGTRAENVALAPLRVAEQSFDREQLVKRGFDFALRSIPTLVDVGLNFLSFPF
ncbi:MAG: hypothetical protein KDD60_06150, partial [Bdellovibrionales bacterium]|nr:hypothetical protein [Bdellovibrionales bacterium]